MSCWAKLNIAVHLLFFHHGFISALKQRCVNDMCLHVKLQANFNHLLHSTSYPSALLMMYWTFSPVTALDSVRNAFDSFSSKVCAHSILQWFFRDDLPRGQIMHIEYIWLTAIILYFMEIPGSWEVIKQDLKFKYCGIHHLLPWGNHSS